MLEHHYLLLAFLAGLGTIQITASLGGYRGLWLVPHRMVTRYLGVALLLSGFALFLLLPLWTNGPWKHGSVRPNSAARDWGRAGWSDLPRANNVNDINGGLSGMQQAIWFPSGVAAAFVVSLIAGSVSARLDGGSGEGSEDSGLEDEDGLGLMKRFGYLGALRRSWPTFRANWSSDWSQAVNVRRKVRAVETSGRRESSR